MMGELGGGFEHSGRCGGGNLSTEEKDGTDEDREGWDMKDGTN